jgi:hypothetical protein
MKVNNEEMILALAKCVEALEEVPCVSNKQESAKVLARQAIRNYYAPRPAHRYLPSRHPACQQNS